MKKILYAKPSITELEINYVNDAISNGWGEHCYDYINRFQDSFKNYLGVEHALATASCTGALHLVFAALGIGSGDEVIVPDLTWIASVAPITYLGAKPVFVDVLPDSWCIDPCKIESAINSKTKAILVVHLYGNLVEMDAVFEVARKHGLHVIEDAAEALGSEYKERKAGSMADFGVFSFHGTKTVTTGEGGMLVSNSDSLYEKAAILADHGRNSKVKKIFWMEQIGYKYKMSNLQAALGCAQLERIAQLIDKKREVFKWYQQSTSDISDIKWNPEPEYAKNSYWMPTMILGQSYSIARDDLIQQLNAKDISVRPFFYPLSSLAMFEEKPENTVSYDVYNRGINFPNYFELSRDDVRYVCKQLKSILS